MSKKTTVWGVILAAGLVAATVALNSPGGSTSLAGRGLSWVMTRVFPPTPAGRPARGLAPAGANAWPSSAALRDIAVRAREKMAHAPAEIAFRDVRATMVPGAFNGDAPGTAFIAFCGEMHVPPNRGWGRTGWKPFYVSDTRSNMRGTTMYLNVADAQGMEKCKGARSPDDFTAIFDQGLVETPTQTD